MMKTPFHNDFTEHSEDLLCRYDDGESLHVCCDAVGSISIKLLLKLKVTRSLTIATTDKRLRRTHIKYIMKDQSTL